MIAKDQLLELKRHGTAQCHTAATRGCARKQNSKALLLFYMGRKVELQVGVGRGRLLASFFLPRMLIMLGLTPVSE